MNDDELDRLLAEIAACRDADSFTGSNPSTARDRLRLAIDAAVRAETVRCAEAADMRVYQCVRDEWDKGANWCARRIAAAIRNRSNTP